MNTIFESDIEQWVIETLAQKGFRYITPSQMDPDNADCLRDGYGSVLINSHLEEALYTINPDVSVAGIQQAVKDIQRITSVPGLIYANQLFHQLLTEGADITYMNNGEERTVKVNVVDFLQPERNKWAVTHQVTIIENGQQKRPDVTLYLNGIPVVVMELKNAVDENATIDKAYTQLQTYHNTIPSLFAYNVFELISDGLEAKVGTITSSFSRFMSWKTADGKTIANNRISELQVMMDGLLSVDVLAELIQNFIVFERFTSEDPVTKTISTGVVKKLAAYHQYYAVKKAVVSTQSAAGNDGDKKGGVVWHTQGSGKSLSMVFYTGLLVRMMNNPTVIVITDRNDLDDQLFDTFANCNQLLRQTPIQIDSRETLIKELKNRQSGGIFFTTIQKFLPENDKEFPQLSERDNIVVIADEAHRTQYGFEAKIKYLKDEEGNQVGTTMSYGFAKHMRDALPNATYIGFTGTPVESQDKNTKAVFGEYVDVYDIERAVRDGATVPIYYENRFVKLKLNELVYKGLEEKLSQVSEDIPQYIIDGAIEKATRQEAIVGHTERLEIIANDIVTHFEERKKDFTGKGLIVAMNRSVAVWLYDHIVKIRPDWHDTRDEYGAIKVIMTGASSDEAYLQPHIRSKKGRSLIADRLKNVNDPLQLVIVVDMWLTGFDAPILHTMYLDKDMSGHNLMQAIARVNRVFNDKPGGLIVDYVPVTGNLKEALKTYTESGGSGKPTLEIGDAVDLMLTKLEVIRDMMHGYDYRRYFDAPVPQKLNILLESEEHILSLENGKERFLRESAALCKAYALSKTEPEANDISYEVAFFQAVRARLSKFDTQVTRERRKEFESTIRSLVESAVSSEGMINLLEESGLEKPEIEIFSEEFMNEIRNMKQKNVAIELLKKLLADQISVRFKANVVINRSFSERLQNAIQKYNNKSLTALEMMELLLEISRDVDEETKRGNDLGLSPTEKAFYDALRVNTSAVQMMGDSKLVEIAKELVERVKRSTTRDWTIRQSAKDRVKLEVKRVLRHYKYPPDDEIRATDTVLEQAEMHAGELVVE